MFEPTILQFAVATFMSLGGLFVFVWAVLSGQFNDIEEAKYKAFRLEVNDHE